MDANTVGPALEHEPRRVLAALGPRMLGLAAGRAWGSLSYLVPVEHTVRARGTLGPQSLLAVEQAVVLDESPGRAREIARAHVGPYLRLAHYAGNLRSLGFSDEDLAGGGSDRLLEALVAWGDAEAIAKRVRAHHDAGADHVCLQVLTAEAGVVPMREWRDLASVLATAG
jgi:probable F420-dependent oxidoreductase